MTPLALRIKNFRSFKAEQIFYFPSQPGLYFMQGLNEVEPRLGGNAAGKTTIWEALTWCIYGVTAEGLKAGDVCNWDASKGVEVHFIFLLPSGEPQMIRRTWGPNSWTLHACSDDLVYDDVHVIDLVKEPGNPVLALLRLELDPWLTSVLTAQGQPMFLDLKQDLQANLFSSTLGLERWVEYSKKASKKAADQDAITRDLERRHAKLQGEAEAMKGRDFTKGEREWKAEQERKLAEIEREHAEGMLKRKKLKAALADAEEALAAAREATQGHKRLEGGGDAELRNLDEQIRKRELSLNKLEVEIGAIERHLEALGESEDCPTCGQPLSPAHLKKERSRCRDAMAVIEAEMDLADKALQRSQRERESLISAIRAAEDQAQAGRRMLEAAEREVSGARRAYDLHERELDRLEDRAEELASEKNPYTDMALEAARKAKELAEDLRAIQRRLDASNERYGLFSYWTKGFKEIRLQEIAEALTELEVEVNSAVTELGLTDWELKFAVDREGKGGGIQRGFSVFVRSPHNPAPTPWKAWSGGEKQRLRLAGNMGLADLIRSRTGATIPLEVWDEPTNGLSPEGWVDLLESLAARAQREQRVIFITDHKAHDFGGFAGTATVIKRPSGSKVVTTWGGA